MRELILIRHGEAEHHQLGLTGGWTDRPLTERGYQQARAAAQAVAKMVSGEARIYCSDLLRARQSAGPLAGLLAMPVEERWQLRELNNGKAANLPEAEAKKLASPRPAGRKAANDWQHYPQSETWRQFSRRIVDVMNEIDQLTEHTAVVVSHKGCIAMIVCWWLLREKMDIDRLFFSCEARPGSVSRLIINRWQERSIVLLNDTSHLTHLR
ncbi:MAG: histidine phosphatase family protein [Negativicutes bacterium]|nr:histidine phosphatase family protein [Negativicutes bacterium]